MKRKKTHYVIIGKHMLVKKEINQYGKIHLLWGVSPVVYQTYLNIDTFFSIGKCLQKVLVLVLYHVLRAFLFCCLQVILYPTSNSSKSAELHRMIVPKNSQDSDLKIKLAVRMDKPPHMKHSGWVFKCSACESLDLLSVYNLRLSGEETDICVEFSQQIDISKLFI